MSRLPVSFFLIACVSCAALLSSCSSIPTSGPSGSQISHASGGPNSAGIQIVDVTDDVARTLFAQRRIGDFSATLGNSTSFQRELGVGDTIEVSIWEAPPA